MSEPLQVWIDQDLCTGDGLCVQYAPEVFEFDVDGLAYVKDGAGDLLDDARRPRRRPGVAAPRRDRLGQGVPRRLHPRRAGRPTTSRSPVPTHPDGRRDRR